MSKNYGIEVNGGQVSAGAMAADQLARRRPR
jgi:hypothetical protein